MSEFRGGAYRQHPERRAARLCRLWQGGILTEAVRRRPIPSCCWTGRKGPSDVHEIFFQVFDKGMMDDSEGRQIDFKNTLILLTSNVGSEEIMAMTGDGAGTADPRS